MKRLLGSVVVTALAILATGCIVQGPHARSSQASYASNCPPGHRWSDGRCHATGKGHDPAKHAK